MALVTCELTWLQDLLKELQFEEVRPITLIGDNQVALHIASRVMSFMRGPNIFEIDRHLITLSERRLNQVTLSQALEIEVLFGHTVLSKYLLLSYFSYFNS